MYLDKHIRFVKAIMNAKILFYSHPIATRVTANNDAQSTCDETARQLVPFLAIKFSQF